MLLWLWMVVGLAFACPDTERAIAEAGEAVDANDYEKLERALLNAQRGLSCGGILESRARQAEFWMAQAVALDALDDRGTADKALVAAWRADPSFDVNRLPNHLRARFRKVIERPYDNARFRLHPPPDPNAVIYVDGRPYQQISAADELSHDASIETKGGLHIIQLAETAIDLEAIAARVLDLPPGVASEFDIYEEDLFGRPLTPLKLGLEIDGPAGGCGKRGR